MSDGDEFASDGDNASLRDQEGTPSASNSPVSGESGAGKEGDMVAAAAAAAAHLLVEGADSGSGSQSEQTTAAAVAATRTATPVSTAHDLTPTQTARDEQSPRIRSDTGSTRSVRSRRATSQPRGTEEYEDAEEMNGGGPACMRCVTTVIATEERIQDAAGERRVAAQLRLLAARRLDMEHGEELPPHLLDNMRHSIAQLELLLARSPIEECEGSFREEMNTYKLSFDELPASAAERPGFAELNELWLKVQAVFECRARLGCAKRQAAVIEAQTRLPVQVPSPFSAYPATHQTYLNHLLSDVPRISRGVDVFHCHIRMAEQHVPGSVAAVAVPEGLPSGEAVEGWVSDYERAIRQAIRDAEEEERADEEAARAMDAETEQIIEKTRKRRAEAAAARVPTIRLVEGVAVEGMNNEARVVFAMWQMRGEHSGATRSSTYEDIASRVNAIGTVLSRADLERSLRRLVAGGVLGLNIQESNYSLNNIEATIGQNGRMIVEKIDGRSRDARKKANRRRRNQQEESTMQL